MRSRLTSVDFRLAGYGCRFTKALKSRGEVTWATATVAPSRRGTSPIGRSHTGGSRRRSPPLRRRRTHGSSRIRPWRWRAMQRCSQGDRRSSSLCARRACLVLRIRTSADQRPAACTSYRWTPPADHPFRSCRVVEHQREGVPLARADHRYAVPDGRCGPSTLGLHRPIAGRK